MNVLTNLIHFDPTDSDLVPIWAGSELSLTLSLEGRLLNNKLA